MGKDRPRPGATERAQPLIAPSERLYGRTRGHTLRPRQAELLAKTLPRLRIDPLDPWAGAATRWLEIGFGAGEHAAAQAAAHPDATLVSCEVFEPGICSLLSRLVPEYADPATAPLPPNLRVWDDDARPLIRAAPDGSLDRAFLLFPDPWPKARHAKRRFVTPERVAEMARVLRPGAEWRIASDDPTYQEWTAQVLERQTLFYGREPAGVRPDDWFATRYEAKARAAGRTPLYWTLRRASP